MAEIKTGRDLDNFDIFEKEVDKIDVGSDSSKELGIDNKNIILKCIYDVDFENHFLNVPQVLTIDDLNEKFNKDKKEILFKKAVEEYYDEYNQKFLFLMKQYYTNLLKEYIKDYDKEIKEYHELPKYTCQTQQEYLKDFCKLFKPLPSCLREKLKTEYYKKKIQEAVISGFDIGKIKLLDENWIPIVNNIKSYNSYIFNRLLNKGEFDFLFNGKFKKLREEGLINKELKQKKYYHFCVIGQHYKSISELLYSFLTTNGKETEIFRVCLDDVTISEDEDKKEEKIIRSDEIIKRMVMDKLTF